MQCTARVWLSGSWRSSRCSRKEWKDGFCKQHHPETVAEREKKKAERDLEKIHSSPTAKLYREVEKNKKMKMSLKNLVLSISINANSEETRTAYEEAKKLLIQLGENLEE